MRIRFTCSCGNVLEADSKLAGGQILCRACGKLPHVPTINAINAAAARAQPEAGEEPASLATAPQAIATNGRRSEGLGRGLGLFLFVILAGLPIALIGYFRDRIDLKSLLAGNLPSLAARPIEPVEKGEPDAGPAADEEPPDDSVLADRFDREKRKEIARAHYEAQLKARRTAERMYPKTAETEADPKAERDREVLYQSTLRIAIAAIARRYDIRDDELELIMREAKEFNWPLDDSAATPGSEPESQARPEPRP